MASSREARPGSIEYDVEQVPIKKEQEPSVDSDNMESRIAARRKRVKKKMEADRRAAIGKETIFDDDDSADVDPEKSRISYKQTKKSEIRLEKLITDGTTLVTNVKVAGDSKEVTRRREEEEAKRARNERLEAEITAGSERFEEITRKWCEVEEKRVPQELQHLIQQQKTSCSAMIDEKDKLIGELQQELKAKDDQYVKHLKSQAEEVDLILNRMKSQAETLLSGFRIELAEIERTYEKERKLLMESQKVEWDNATTDRLAKEKFYLEDREKRIERNELEIQHLRVRNAEEFNYIKIKLETDIQSLQQQIQQMKATFQLNAEKLEYNFQVLRKRDEENTKAINQQKRRLTRLQDTLNNLRGKFNKQEKACKAELQLLMDEYRKNTEQYRELIKKVKHFQAIDTKRFHDVWVMNEEKVRALVKEVVNADEIIHSQQLGLEWKCPPPVDSPMTKHLSGKLHEKDMSKAMLYSSQILSDAESEINSVNDVESVTVATTSASNKIHSPVLIKQVLHLLCSECEFLIENKLLRLLALLEQDEQMMMKLDSIFKAIDVTTEDDIHELVTYFIAKPHPEDHESKEEDTPRGVQLIHPNEVLTRLCSFVDDQQKRSGPIETPVLTKGLIKAQGHRHKELLDGSFWKQMSQVLPEKNEKVWSALLSGLEKYHTSLQARDTLINDTDHLRQQNMELRLLLQQYMHARINRELEIPPTLTLPVQVQPSTV